jgi:hypothetical protein
MQPRTGETIVHKGRPHWIVFGWAILLGLLNARFMLGADLATSRAVTKVYLIIASMLAVYALGAVCASHLYRWSSRLILTSRRVVLKRGVLRQRSGEFLLPTIESGLVEFPVAGRLFNYGTVAVRGFGGNQEFIKRISSPERVRELIQEQQSLARPLARTSRRFATC